MAAPGWLKFLMVVAFGAIMLGVSQGVHFISNSYGVLWLLPLFPIIFGLAYLMDRMGWGPPPEPETPRDPRPWTRRLSHRIATLGMGWAGIAVAPLFAPAGRYIEKREAGAAIPSAAFSASVTFLFAAFLWFVAVGLPITLFVISLIS